MDIFDIVGPIAVILLTIAVIVTLNIYDQEEKKIIKNTQEYFEYDRCRHLDDKWYCYNEK